MEDGVYSVILGLGRCCCMARNLLFCRHRERSAAIHAF